jgi:hypothetical protein
VYLMNISELYLFDEDSHSSLDQTIITQTP